MFYLYSGTENYVVDMGTLRRVHGFAEDVPSPANDALTLSSAHRLIQSLSEQTQSRSELAECRDVMAALERMVEEG